MKLKIRSFEIIFDKKTPLIILFFLYIFSPPLLPINMNVAIEFIAVIYIFFSLNKYRNNLQIKLRLLMLPLFFIPFLIYISIMLYMHIRLEPNNMNLFIDTYNIIIRVVMRGAVICCAYSFYCNRNDISVNDWFNIIYWVGIIQIIFVLLTLTFPQLRQTILDMIQQNSTADVLAEVVGRLSSRRGYGLASNLFDAFGYILGFIMCATILLWLENGKKSIC